MRINDVISDHNNVPQYQVDKRLGEGAFGEVFRAQSLHGDASVALKEVLLSHDADSDDTDELVAQELLLLLHFRKCPGVTQVFGAVPCASSSVDGVVLVQELLDFDMQRWLASAPQLEMRQVKLLLYQLLGALCHLHAAGVVHRDLKTANLLLYREWFLKLGDLGAATYVGQPAFARIGTFASRAPELLVSVLPESTASDIWAVGLCFQQLLAVMYKRALVIDEDSWDSDPRDVLANVLSVTGMPSDEVFAAVVVPESTQACDVPDALLCDEYKEGCSDWDGMYPLLHASWHTNTFSSTPHHLATTDIQRYAATLREMREDNTWTREERLDWGVWAGHTLPEGTQGLLASMLEFDPARRTGAAAALRHEFFTGDDRFMEEIKLMGVYVPEEVRWPRAVPQAGRTLQDVLDDLQQRGHNADDLGDFYLHRKKVVGKLLVSRLAIPADVEDARRTLHFRKHKPELLIRRSESGRYAKIFGFHPKLRRLGNVVQKC